MTTEITSPTLHERLQKAAHSYGTFSGLTSFRGVPDEKIAAIEAAMTAEATAPLLAKIDSIREKNKALYHTSTIEIDRLRAENAALRQAGDAMASAADDAYMVIGNPLEPHEEWRELGNAVSAWKAATTPRAKETPMKMSDVVNLVADPRVPEGVALILDGENVVGGITGLSRTFRDDETGDAVTYTETQAVRLGESAEITRLKTIINRYQTRLNRAYENNAKLAAKIPKAALSPTDAAGEGEDYEPDIHFKGKLKARLKCIDERTFTDLVESVAALEQRADDANERLDFLHSDTDRRLLDLETKVDSPLGDGGPSLPELAYQQDIDICKINHGEIKIDRRLKQVERRHRKLRKYARGTRGLVILNEQRLDDLEARTTPQPVAEVSMDDLSLAFWSAFWEDDTVRHKVDIPDDLAPHIERALRAGLAAALAAAKEAGK